MTFTPQWFQLPSPSSCPLPPSWSSGLNGDNTRHSVIDAWGGAAFREKGAWYMLHGGGHGDYFDNSIIGLSLLADSPTWSVLMDCTPAASLNSSVANGWNNDSPQKPVAMHTYETMQWDGIDDKLIRCWGQGFNGEDGFQAFCASWVFGSSQWEPPGTIPNNTVLAAAGDPPCVACDPLTGDIYLWHTSHRGKWTRALNSWAVITTGESLQRAKAATAFDTRRQCLWYIGGDNTLANTVYKWDIVAGVTSAVTITDTAGICQALNYPSGCYDLINDCMWVVTGDGNLYKFDPNALGTSLVTTTGSGPLANTAYTPANTTGCNGRLKYVECLKGIVFTPAWAAPTFFARTA